MKHLEIEKQLERVYRIKLKKEKLEKEYEKEKNNILSQLNNNRTNNYIYKNDMFNCFVSKRTKTKYRIEQIKKLLPKRIQNKIVIKTIIIKDYYGLVNLLKKYGVPPKEFKKYLIINEQVNKQVYEIEYEIGNISEEQNNKIVQKEEGEPFLTFRKASI